MEALKNVYPTAWASGDYARQTDSASAYSHPYVDHSAQHTATYPADGYYNEYEVDDEDHPHHQQPRHQQKQQGETGSMASTGWEKEDNEGIDEEGEDYDNED